MKKILLALLASQILNAEVPWAAELAILTPDNRESSRLGLVICPGHQDERPVASFLLN